MRWPVSRRQYAFTFPRRPNPRNARQNNRSQHLRRKSIELQRSAADSAALDRKIVNFRGGSMSKNSHKYVDVAIVGGGAEDDTYFALSGQFFVAK